jgi:hypothetical protein
VDIIVKTQKILNGAKLRLYVATFWSDTCDGFTQGK